MTQDATLLDSIVASRRVIVDFFDSIDPLRTATMMQFIGRPSMASQSHAVVLFLLLPSWQSCCRAQHEVLRHLAGRGQPPECDEQLRASPTIFVLRVAPGP